MGDIAFADCFGVIRMVRIKRFDLVRKVVTMEANKNFMTQFGLNADTRIEYLLTGTAEVELVQSKSEEVLIVKVELLQPAASHKLIAKFKK